MKFLHRPIALAVLVATSQIAGLAYGQAPKTPAAPAIQTALSAPGAPIAIKAPDSWILYEDATYTPVVDDVSRHLDAARKAFDAKDSRKAATDESGKIKTRADLDKAIDKAARADMERRWLVSDVTTWYPVSEEPQRHFTDALAAFVRKDYEAAATDIRKASSYLRLELGRAVGDAKRELDASVAQLDALAVSVGKGAVKDEQRLTGTFARASNALAFGHRAKAAESWARGEYDKVGYELKAAAHGLASAAGWAGGVKPRRVRSQPWPVPGPWATSSPPAPPGHRTRSPRASNPWVAA